MPTNVRLEVSKKNPYYIERERYYELKHFCRQYPIWKKAHAALDGLSRRPADLELFSETGETSDPTFRCVAARERYSRWMGMVEQCAREADPELYKYLMSYVTKGDCYSVLKMRDHIPAARMCSTRRPVSSFGSLTKFETDLASSAENTSTFMEDPILERSLTYEPSF